MNIGFKQIVVSILFLLGLTQAFAQPSGHRRDERDALRAFYAQQAAQERGAQMIEPQRQGERRGREFGDPDSSGFSGQGDSQPNAEPSRKQGKMSPEERRTLRRQIDEASHDIYRSKR